MSVNHKILRTANAPTTSPDETETSVAQALVDLEANVLNRTADGRVCTANILGASFVTPPQWQIGQTWFQGRYVQHNLNASTIAFADLI